MKASVKSYTWGGKTTHISTEDGDGEDKEELCKEGPGCSDGLHIGYETAAGPCDQEHQWSKQVKGGGPSHSALPW